MPKIDALAPLRERLTRLDRTDPAPAGVPTRSDVEHFVDVMSTITHTQLMYAPHPSPAAHPPLASPADADGLVNGSTLLSSIEDVDPTLVSAPLKRNRQVWIEAKVPNSRLPNGGGPSKRLFMSATPSSPASTKPFGTGMFTSTLLDREQSMWRAYLNAYHGPHLFPRPWKIWKLCFEPSSRVAEITSAHEWVDFVTRYALSHRGLIYPNWARVGDDYAGVHMTARAIVAAQGFRFCTRQGPTAAPYWDVESTLWLRWRVVGSALLEHVP
jgi:hypothetical protein